MLAETGTNPALNSKIAKGQLTAACCITNELSRKSKKRIAGEKDCRDDEKYGVWFKEDSLYRVI